MTDISPAMRKALNEVEAALSPLPEGYTVEPTANGNAIIVACKYPEPEGLGFAITELEIKDGKHVERAVENFGPLMRAVETGNRSDGSKTSYLQ
jgi:hypothetical protein